MAGPTGRQSETFGPSVARNPLDVVPFRGSGSKAPASPRGVLYTPSHPSFAIEVSAPGMNGSKATGANTVVINARVVNHNVQHEPTNPPAAAAPQVAVDLPAPGMNLADATSLIDVMLAKNINRGTTQATFQVHGHFERALRR